MKIVVLLVLSSLISLSKTDPKKNPYFIPGMDVVKEDFFKFLKQESPKTFCDDKSYFIKCFDVIPSQCPDETKSSFEDCKKSVKIPSTFDVLELDHFASKLGECVGVDLEKKWSERKRGSRECKKRF